MAESKACRLVTYLTTLDPMIFAAATDERSLMVFATVAETISHCEGIDVEDGGWLFWDERGDALKPEFLSENLRGRFTVGSGAYRLVEAPDRPTLTEALAGILGMEPNPHFASMAALREFLGGPASPGPPVA